MGVYIKGMEMPKSCAECRFFVDVWCYAFEADDWRNAYNRPPKGERLDNCPLVPVPPHGRLVDADRIGFAMMDAANADQALAMVDDAPIVLEAEDGE